MAIRLGNMETVADLIFWGSKITADGDSSHEIKRHLLFGRKVMANLDITLKSRDTTLPTNIHLVKTMVFPVVMYGCESWTIKKAECWRIETFERWCWRRLLRIPWIERKLNQSILKEISPEYSLEGLRLKLKLQLNGHEFGQAPGVGDRQGSLACCSPRGCKELDTTEWLNWTEDKGGKAIRGEKTVFSRSDSGKIRWLPVKQRNYNIL